MSDLTRLIKITKLQKQLVNAGLLRNNSLIQKMHRQCDELEKFILDYSAKNLPKNISVDRIVYSSHFRNKLLENIEILKKEQYELEKKNYSLVQKSFKLDRILDYLSDKLLIEYKEKIEKRTAYETSMIMDILLTKSDAEPPSST